MDGQGRDSQLVLFKFQVHRVMIWCQYTLQVNTTTSLAIVYHQKLTHPFTHFTYTPTPFPSDNN